MEPVRGSSAKLQLLSALLFAEEPPSKRRPDFSGSAVNYSNRASELALRLRQQDLDELKCLASTNRVVIRAFEPLQRIYVTEGKPVLASWVSRVIQQEVARILHAVGFLANICATLELEGCPVTVIKSLDHLPDFGSDLDLYTDAAPLRLIELMRLHFKATLAERSWGDRLANKWNFVVPGLPELVEVHIRRLGQTGEQTVLPQLLATRTRIIELKERTFRVAAPEDRIVISTLQRMYRHFYIRLCDIADNALLVDSQVVDFAYLRELGSVTGLWKGIATYLTSISEYVQAYRGKGMCLPAAVAESAECGLGQFQCRGNFLRVPILPCALSLYGDELKNLVLKGEFRNSCRLMLLPGLAAAAALQAKITGSDKGIW